LYVLVFIFMCGFTDVTIPNQIQISVVLQLQSRHFLVPEPENRSGSRIQKRKWPI